MGISSVTVLRSKERAFASDFLEFATEKFGATTIRGWTVMIEHIEDPGRWMDLLFDVARNAGSSPQLWHSSDGWMFAWDMKKEGVFSHLTDHTERQRLSKQTGFEDFDPKIAAKAINYDLLIFLNDALASINRQGYYLPYVIAHECLHAIEDWISGQELVIDYVHPWQDQKVIAALNEFINKIGMDEFKRRYA